MLNAYQNPLTKKTMYQITNIKHKNPLLNQLIITNTALKFEAIIYPNLGASLQKLSSNEMDLIDGISNSEEGLNDYKSTYKSSILFPFPNRIHNGTYEFKGKKYKLNINETSLNNSLHGCIYNTHFTLKNDNVSNDKASVTLHYSNKGTTLGFPFSYNFEINYIFTRHKMSLNFAVLNSGNEAFPFGIGWHPYFKTNNITESVLDFNATHQYLFNEQMIPSSKTLLKHRTPLKIGATFLDDCFITNKPATNFKTLEYDFDLEFSSKEKESYLQVYTPPHRKSIAIEPMTCAPNSFNNKDGLLTLQPNEKFDWEIELSYQSKY